MTLVSSSPVHPRSLGDSAAILYTVTRLSKPGENSSGKTQVRQRNPVFELGPSLRHAPGRLLNVYPVPLPLLRSSSQLSNTTGSE